MPLTILLLLPFTYAAAPAEPAPAWQLGADLPLALYSSTSAANNAAVIVAGAGLRGEAAFYSKFWLAALQLELAATVPDRRGTRRLSLQTQEDTVSVGARVGHHQKTRGFVFEPFLSAHLLAGSRLLWTQLDQQTEFRTQMVAGAGAGFGVTVGYQLLRFRFDWSTRFTDRGLGFLIALGFGMAFPLNQQSNI